jgi:hypothetical protein
VTVEAYTPRDPGAAADRIGTLVDGTCVSAERAPGEAWLWALSPWFLPSRACVQRDFVEVRRGAGAWLCA